MRHMTVFTSTVLLVIIRAVRDSPARHPFHSEAEVPWGMRIKTTLIVQLWNLISCIFSCRDWSEVSIRLALAQPVASSSYVCSPDVEMCIGVTMYIVASLPIIEVGPESDIGTPQHITFGVEIWVMFYSEQQLAHQISINSLIPRGQGSWLGLDNAEPSPTDAVQRVGMVEVKKMNKRQVLFAGRLHR